MKKIITGTMTTIIISLLSLNVFALDKTTIHKKTGGMGISAGARLDLVPASKFKAEGGGSSQTTDGEFGAGFGVVSSWQLYEHLSVGLEFMYYTLKQENAQDRDGITDFGPRITANYPLENIGPLDLLVPYAYLSLGLSSFSPGASGAESRTGFWLQFGGGGEIIFKNNIGVFAELGYNASFLGEKNGIDMSYSSFGMAFGAKYYF
jgi:hypothetical protein